MNYQKITKVDIANGEGVRVVLWVSGCDHHCRGCHNPQTWDPDSGQMFTKETFTELVEALNKPYTSGLTLSGGDPLHPKNVEVVKWICQQVKELFPEKTIWLYTGYTWEEINHYTWIMDLVDVLVDGEFMEDLKDISLPFCGSRNQKVIDVKKGELYDWK